MKCLVRSMDVFEGHRLYGLTQSVVYQVLSDKKYIFLTVFPELVGGRRLCRVWWPAVCCSLCAVLWAGDELELSDGIPVQFSAPLGGRRSPPGDDQMAASLPPRTHQKLRLSVTNTDCNTKTNKARRYEHMNETALQIYRMFFSLVVHMMRMIIIYLRYTITLSGSWLCNLTFSIWPCMLFGARMRHFVIFVSLLPDQLNFIIITIIL